MTDKTPNTTTTESVEPAEAEVTFNQVLMNISRALDEGHISLEYLCKVVLGKETTDCDALAAYLVITTYLAKHEPDKCAQATDILRRSLRKMHPSVAQ